ncbi:DUF2690 domain-containing protein [Streptomyces palmae]|uniref:DUF2690 domain-containing protein n=1 Tax=Streptomyces palmae TaxID=1701085 RepID=A0A4Z0FNK1_9ACTN|nr:DUF2690 domain-containing protein [Streptomyces palmae]TGA84537.1 DUF2690 domain-containing protein [Streptomyces palmae]
MRWPVLAAVAVVAVVAGAVLFWTFGGTSDQPADQVYLAGRSAPVDEQPDVECFADSCAGKDPKKAGCGADAWTSALRRVGKVYVELRYSDACAAAWARISWGRPGDVARVVGAKGRSYQDKVHYDTDVFSAMVPAPSPSAARACTRLTSGAHGCTKPGGTQRLTEPPEPPPTPSRSPEAAASPSPLLSRTGPAGPPATGDGCRDRPSSSAGAYSRDLTTSGHQDMPPSRGGEVCAGEGGSTMSGGTLMAYGAYERMAT